MGLFGILPHGILLNAAASFAGVMEEANILNNDKTGNESMNNMKGESNKNTPLEKTTGVSYSGTHKPIEYSDGNILSVDVTLSEVKSDKEMLAEKNVKAAIMARNMSHNLGSHVLSYTQRDISAFIDGDAKSSSSYMHGLRHLLKYLQERQDFIATVATARVPYFLPLAFKETVFDFVNPDYKAKRHPTLPMVDNILLKHIARSESYDHYTPFEEKKEEEGEFKEEKIKGRQVLVSMYNRKESKIVRGDESQESLDFIRDKNYMFPGGVVGRHAIMSIIENLIRNAAKHEKIDGDLELLMELCSYKDLISRDDLHNPIILDDKKVCEMYENSADGRKMDYLIFSYRVAKTDEVSETVNHLKYKGLLDPYCDKNQITIGTNKGIKEIRISASWLRGIFDEDRYKIWMDPNPDRPYKDDEEKRKVEESLKLRELAPLVYVQSSQLKVDDSNNTYIQFIIGLRKSLSISVIKEGLEDEAVSKIQKTFGEECVVYNTIEEYIKDSFSNSAEYTIVATEEIKNKIRPFSYERIVVCPQQVENLNKINALRAITEAFMSDSNLGGKIWVDESTSEKTNIKIISINEEQTYVERFGEDPKKQYEYLYKKHLNQESEWDIFVGWLKKGKLRNLQFVESLTGNNSTDRLVRQSTRDTLWFLRQIYAMKQKVAIIDERLYDMVSDEKMWQRALLLKLKGVYLFKIDENSGTLYGFSSHDDYSEHQCVELGTVDITNDTKICFNDNINLPKFDYISIHQGILDKLYGIDKNIERREVTDGIYGCLSCHQKSPIGNGFQEGLMIHSGRSKPEYSNMPQKLPFIQYSALSDALFDCKYTLIDLLSYAKYE